MFFHLFVSVYNVTPVKMAIIKKKKKGTKRLSVGEDKE